jgi:hypothetical protein
MTGRRMCSDAEAVARGFTGARVAAYLGVSVRTLYRCLAQDALSALDLRKWARREAIRILRRRVLHETLAAFHRCQPHDRYHRTAAANLSRWRAG